MNKQFLQEIPEWESDYREMKGDSLSKRQKEILDGDEINSHEGMTFGQMYADWKKEKGYD